MVRVLSNPTLTFAWDPLPEPVLTRGTGWESTDVLNPSVFREGDHLMGVGYGPAMYEYHRKKRSSSPA